MAERRETRGRGVSDDGEVLWVRDVGTMSQCTYRVHPAGRWRYHRDNRFYSDNQGFMEGGMVFHSAIYPRNLRWLVEDE